MCDWIKSGGEDRQDDFIAYWSLRENAPRVRGERGVHARAALRAYAAPPAGVDAGAGDGAGFGAGSVARGPTRLAMRSLVKTSGRAAGMLTAIASSAPTVLSALSSVSRIDSVAAVNR